MDLYRRIIARFPLGNVSYIFAYGSGVKQQIGYTNVEQKPDSKSVIDLIFCVRDSLGFHAENIHRHPDHYSGLRHLGANFVTQYQERLGASVYCNTLIPLDDVGVTIKYGVVNEDDFVNDLLTWKHLYLAGRLHKPVKDLVNISDNPKLTSAIEKNLLSACQVALLMLPEKFTEYDLFHAIAGLSYKGDFRMIFGENKQKVRNIILPQLEEFFKLYEPSMRKLSDYLAVNMHGVEKGSNQKTIIFEQDKSIIAKRYHLRHLPNELCQRLQRNAACRGDYTDVIEFLTVAPLLPKIVQVSVNDIVWRSSVTQSIKNIASAGLLKSVVYSYRKAQKTFAV